MKMSIEEYSNYLQQLQQPPESKETIVQKHVNAKAKAAKKTLKRKTYRKSR